MRWEENLEFTLSRSLSP